MNRPAGHALSSDLTMKFLFDYVSPYSYLAWTQLPRLTEEYGVHVEPVPVLFAGLLEAHGHSGPAEIPAKRTWMIENVLQTASLLDVQISPPAFHPFNPLLALRVTACSENDEEENRIMGACFRAAWQDSAHLSDPSVLQSLLDEIGIDGASAIERANSMEAKDMLRRNTNDAVAAGVFGVPAFIHDDQLFWGISDLPIIEARLSGKQVLDTDASRYWKKSVRSSAKRKGR